MKRFMARDARKIFEAHWEEAKKRLGAWNAGLTLKAFLEKNIKVSRAPCQCVCPRSLTCVAGN